jgi:ligand-binding sensor domain-containing protein
MYWAVLQTKSVRVVGALCLLLCLLPLLYLLFVVNPRLQVRADRNTIDHISDIRPAHDYTRAEITAMAGAEKWLALGTADRGLTLLNKESRVPRERVLKIPVLDVTRGWSSNDFLVLQADQAIAYFGMEGRSANRLTRRTWLARPENPVWPISLETGSPDLAANTVDAAGWLLAVRGWGIARYRFDTADTGPPVRTRSWQSGDAANLDLDQAIIASDGVWYTLQGGGVGYALRATLNQVAVRSISTPPLLRFDADGTGQWASAVDEQDGLWVYSAAGTGWLGPYFSRSTQECQLQSLADVTTARLDGTLAWLGTKSSLLTYDSRRRRIECAASNLQVADLALPRDDHALSGMGTAFVSSSQGLYLVTQQGPQGGFSISTLDSSAVESLSLSPDSSLLVYQTRDSGWPAGSQAEAIAWFHPLTGTMSTVISPHTGWKDLASAPEVVGIEPLGNGLAFGTSAGAFSYDFQQHSYKDLSTSLLLLPDSSREVELTAFTDIHRDEKDLLALADGSPQVLQTASDGRQLWVNLDPTQQAQAAQLVQSNGRLLGLGTGGLLYSYQYPAPLGATSSLVGSSASLASTPPPENQAVGDVLSVDQNHWITSFVNGEVLITYESRTGSMSEASLPSQTGGAANVVQMRRVENSPTYLLADGRILNESGQVQLDNGTLPFDPGQASAIAPGRDGKTVLIGGPEGNVVNYEWQTGHTYLLGGEAIPASESIITEIRDTSGGSFAQLSDNRLFHTWGTDWEELPGCRRWATDDAGSTVALLNDAGLDVTHPDTSRPVSAWSYATFSRSSGMKAFVDRARFAWPLSSTEVAFFSPGSEIGVYDRSSDSWYTKETARLSDPSQFVTNDRSIVLLDGQRLVRIDTNLLAHELATLPADASSPSLHLASDNRLQVAFVEGGAAILWTWDDVGLKGSPAHYRRGGSVAPAGFDAAQVIYALGPDGSPHLWDQAGNCAVYVPETGSWDQLRQANPGESVYGWLIRSAGEPADLLLDTDRGNLRLVPGNLQGEHGLPIGSETLESLIAAADQPCDTWSPPQLAEYLCLGPTLARKLLAGMGLYPASVVRPGSGTLFESSQLRIVREGMQTTYQIAVSGKWRPLLVADGGFSQDRAAGAVLSSGGEQWVLQGRELVRLEKTPGGDGLLPSESTIMLSGEPLSAERLPTSQIRVRYADGAADYLSGSVAPALKVMPAFDSQTLAGLDFAGHELLWAWRLDGPLTTSWRDESLPVWSASGESLALQSLRDVALTPDGDFLLATELGVIVRRVSDYSLVAIHPDLREARFVRTEGPQRLWIATDSGLFEWKDGSPGMASQPDGLTSTAASGPWLWQVQPLGSTPHGVLAVLSTDARTRRWTQVGWQTWRFADDVVNGIRRDPVTGQTWLDTEDGLWPYSRANGRQLPSGPAPDLSSDDVIVKTPAIQVLYSARRVTFSPSDGADRVAFEEGRFFFDNGSQIASCDGSLCALVPGRGIVRRDPADLGMITGFWALPSGFPKSAAPRLSAIPGGLRLEVANPFGPGGQAWEMDLRNQPSEWSESEIPDEPVVASDQFIQWRRTFGTHIEPFLFVQGEQVPRELPSWWRGDRFAWDRVTCTGALDRGTVMLATPVGPIAWQVARDGSLHGAAVGPVAEMSSCFVARHEGSSIGLVVTAAEDGAQFLASIDDQGNLAVRRTRTDEFSPSRALLTLGHVGTASEGYVGFQESWLACGLGETCTGSAIQAQLSGLSEGLLLRDGQFIFDRADGAAPVGGSGGSSWFAFTRCEDGAGSACVTTLNSLKADGAAGHSYFLLRDVWPSPMDLVALRPSPEGGALGLLPDGDAAGGKTVWLRIEGDKLTSQFLELDLARSAFRVGDIVSLELSTLSWTSVPAYVWSSAPPFATSPAGYPLFSAQPGGVSLAFDVITSLSSDQLTSQLAVGTQGGVYVIPLAEDATPFLALSDKRRHFAFSSTADPAQWVLPVQRLRRDTRGSLWAQFGDPHRAAVLVEGDRWQISDEAWSTAWSHVGDVAIHIDDVGFAAYGIEYVQSNDLLKRGRRPIRDIVDFALDDRSHTLWLATRHDGVFKVLLKSLPR